MSSEQTTYALIGAAGYIAPRHLKAIKETNGDLQAAFDRSDSVGIMDSYFPSTRFFTEIERFDRYLDRCNREGFPLNYVSVCSPNYLHDSHIRMALRSGCNAICEKPLVLNPWNIDGLEQVEKDTGKTIYTILQLRLHPAIVALRDRIQGSYDSLIHEVDLAYITSRGSWYYVSWKGDEDKSGGIATNIGVHFFDMLSFVFGDLKRSIVHHRAADCAAGYLEFQKARVRWFLSINERDLPDEVRDKQKTFRSITVDGEEVEFSQGFTDLHTQSYENILAGNGFTIEETRPSIEAVSHIRTADIEINRGEQHPFVTKVRLEEGRYRNGWPV